MQGTIRLDVSRARPFLAPEEIANQADAVRAAHEMLRQRTGPGSDSLGWTDLPVSHDRAEFARIKAAAARIQADSDALVVIGIGGSYLGARAAIEALCHSFHNELPSAVRRAPRVYFAGKDISPVYLRHLLEVLDGQEVSVNVISKSGTTTEPAIAFRIFREYMEQRYGKEGARKRIYATTDRARGALRQLAEEEGYERFVIPDDVGGRFSVLTAVGLLPIAVSGVDIGQLMGGAAAAMEAYAVDDLDANPAYQYAAARNALYRKGKAVELLVSYEPGLRTTGEWWKQLFGESEGKEQKGIFPASAAFSTDLHSLGQYLQDGMRILFETVVHVEQPAVDQAVPADASDRDGLGFLTGASIDWINKRAFEGTLLAHADGGVPNLVVSVPSLTPFHYGQLLYFFQKACGISGHLLGVNPFDQPGVEAYKRNMFALLGKPGFEAEREALLRRLS